MWVHAFNPNAWEEDIWDKDSLVYRAGVRPARAAKWDAISKKKERKNLKEFPKMWKYLRIRTYKQKNESFLIFRDPWIKKLFESCVSLRSETQEGGGSNHTYHTRRRKGCMALDGQNPCPLHHNPRHIQRQTLHHVCAAPTAGRRGDWSYAWMIAITTWSEPGSSAGSASSRNHWLLSPAPSYAFLVEDSMRGSLFQEWPALHISSNGFAKAQSTFIFPLFPL